MLPTTLTLPRFASGPPKRSIRYAALLFSFTSRISGWREAAFARHIRRAVAQRIPALRCIHVAIGEAFGVQIVVVQRGAIEEHQRPTGEHIAVVVAVQAGGFPDAGRIAVERVRVATGRRIRRRLRVVDVEARTVAVPGRRDRRPVVRGVAHLLLAIGEAYARLQRAQPATAAKVVFHVGTRRDFVGVVVFPVVLDELHPVVMRIGEKAVGVVHVRARRQRDHRRAITIGRVVHLRQTVGGDQDVVVAGLRLDVLHVELRVQVLGDVPLHVEGEIRGLLFVVEDARLVAHVGSREAHAAAGILAIHERHGPAPRNRG